MLGKTVKRLNRDDRLAIAAYRHDLLQDFCTKNALPLPLFATYPHGKPYCTNSTLSFNQSHSHQSYVLAFGKENLDIGVDIENLDRRVNQHDLAKAYFSDDEWALWQQDQSPASFFAIWTAKEALLKAHGLGIRLALNTLNTKPSRQHHYPQHIYHDTLGDFVYQSFVLDNAVISVAHKALPNLATPDIIWV